MKPSIIVLALTALVFSSCSTAYKTGQTPDDVYYSPARDQDEYVVVEKTDDRAYQGEDYYGDRFLRMRVQNRYRWSAFDDYYNNPYAYSPYNSYSNWNSPWNSYWAWNSYYNPYCGSGGIIIKNPTRYLPPSRAVVFNPNSYNNNNSPSNMNAKSYAPGSRQANANANAARYNNSNSNSGNSGSLGNSIRKVFNGSGNSSSNNNSRSDNNSTPSRTYTPSSSSSSSSSGSRSSGGSSGGSSRPIR